VHVDIYGSTKAVSRPARKPADEQEQSWFDWALSYVPGVSQAQSIVETGEETRQTLLDTVQQTTDRAATAAERTAKVIRITAIVLGTVTVGSIAFGVWSRHRARMTRAKVKK
jgi:hypothetical protein